jgi:hypothetical protein
MRIPPSHRLPMVTLEALPVCKDCYGCAGQTTVSIHTQTLGRDLRAISYCKLTAPLRHHAQNAGAIPALKKLPRPGDSDPGGTPIELSWQDEARVGQKNGTTRGRAKRGTQLSAARDQRTTSAYIYSAICPAEGKGEAGVLPGCNTKGMMLDLAGISAAVAPCAHAILILDEAGWPL